MVAATRAGSAGIDWASLISMAANVSESASDSTPHVVPAPKAAQVVEVAPPAAPLPIFRDPAPVEDDLCACANCCRALDVNGFSESGFVGPDAKHYCGPNCFHSKRLRNDAKRRAAASDKHKRPYTDRIYRERRDAFNLNRIYKDDVSESSNALYVFHGNFCASWRPKASKPL